MVVAAARVTDFRRLIHIARAVGPQPCANGQSRMRTHQCPNRSMGPGGAGRHQMKHTEEDMSSIKVLVLRSGGRLAREVRRLGKSEAGMATAEYAIATLAAVGFAALLVAILSSGEVRGMLMNLISSALSFG